MSFPGFWNDPETNVSTETLVINQSLLNNSHRVIEIHNLIYTTRSVPQKYQVYAGANVIPQGTDGSYMAVGWLGDKYVSLDGSRLARIIFEQNASDAKVMRIGESWVLGDGYKLIAMSITANPGSVRQGWFVLYKNNFKLEDRIIAPKDVWSYRQNINDRIPTFIFYFRNTYVLPDTDGADLKYTWLRSQNTIEIKEGDIFGIMEVTSINNGSIELRNKEAINLAPAKVINLMGNISIQVGSSDTNLSFHPFKARKP